MKILFVSNNGNSLGLAERVKAEGHISSLYTLNKRASRVGMGIVDKPLTTQPLCNGNGNAIATNTDTLLRECSPDLVVFDRVGMGKVADYIREKGIPVLGGCRWADSAELDRDYGCKLMNQVGIKVPEEGSILVGVSVRCELWWNGLQSLIHNLTLIDSRFLTGGLGSDCGCAGTIVRTLPPDCKLVMEGVGRMERLLKKTNYRGPITLNSIATKEGLYGLGITVRFSYDSLQALLEIYKGSITQMLCSAASGSMEMGEFTSDYGTSLRISIPPYPHTDDGKYVQRGVPILGVNEHNSKHLWWRDVERGKEGYVSAGLSGNLLTVVARGRYPEEAIKRMYRTTVNLTIPNVQYRTDVGEKGKVDEQLLKKWGYV